MINRVILVGRLTKDVELRKTATGLSTTSFTLACNRRMARGSEGQQTADFINCVAWRQQADFLANYAKKGAIVGVEGRITTRNYENASGQRVYVTEVTCDTVQLIGGSRSSSETTTPTPAVSHQDDYEDLNSVPNLDISSDDLPFY